MNLPHFLILGPHKTGSTSLWLALQKHPDIEVASSRKELRLLNSPNFNDWDLQQYSKHFSKLSPAKTLFEATPNYFASAQARARIALTLPKVKLIITLRDPVERLISHVVNFRAVHLAGTDPNCNERYYKLLPHKNRKDSPWKGEARTVDQIISDFSERKLEHYPYNYFSLGEYIYHLKAWYQLFPKEQIKILFFSDLKRHPNKTLAELQEFLNLNTTPLNLPHNNSSSKWNQIAGTDLTTEFSDSHISFLRDHYRRYDELLASALDRPLPWQRGKNKKTTKQKPNKKNQERALPGFIFVGAGKTGTTSLFYALSQHSKIVPPKRKEVEFFNKQEFFDQGLSFYKSFFPALTELEEDQVTFEASPGYFLLDPEKIKWMTEHLNNPKIICTLRNPIKRFLSAYKHFHGNHIILSNPEMLKPAGPDSGPNPGPNAHCLTKTLAEYFAEFEKGEYTGILREGIYVEIIEKWMKLAGKERVHVIVLEELIENPSRQLNKLLSFLELPIEELRLKHSNPASLRTDKIKDPSIFDLSYSQEQWLKDFYAPYNRKLFEFLGRDLGWND